MNGIRHPFTHALYELDADGAIRVTLDGRAGLFTVEGRWISGELREADPQLCGWVGGPRLQSARATSAAAGNGAT
jgi:hypothetical protein